MNNLIIIKNNEPLTTSLIVAEQLKRKHFSIMKLIQENIISFKKFGVIQLEVEEPKKNTKGGRPEKFISLNEQQLTFLIIMLIGKIKNG
jgi:phage regulator Rha-like protein